MFQIHGSFRRPGGREFHADLVRPTFVDLKLAHFTFKNEKRNPIKCVIALLLQPHTIQKSVSIVELKRRVYRNVLVKMWGIV